MKEWVSPNGVSHITLANGSCITCGRSHDPADDLADEIARGIIDECEGDLDMAIKVVEKTKYLLGKLNNPQAQFIEYDPVGMTYTQMVDRVAALRDAKVEFNGTWVGFGDAADATNPPKFGVTDYWTDGR